MQIKLEVILPAHNEEGNIRPIYNEIMQALSSTNYQFTILFVDDGSTDKTLSIIKELASSDAKVKYIELSRNFGHQNALKAGLDATFADVLIMMDCDLQHPPSLIKELLNKYEQGYDVVRTRRLENDKVGYIKRKSSNLFYKTLNQLSDITLEQGSADFRLISGKTIDQLKSFNEFDLFYRGLIKWMGFKQISIEYHPEERLSGQTKYSYKKMISFGLKGFTSFSTKPLYFAAYLGLIFSAASILFIPYIIYALYAGTQVQGWASVIAAVGFFGGLNLMILGIIGIYLSKLFTQSKNRPHYIIKESNL
jgi:glycosyltransferase involved in cell wall biosynthesis